MENDTDYFAEKVKDNLVALQDIFELTDKELMKAMDHAETIGYQSAKPSSIAIAIIKIVKPKTDNYLIYKKGKMWYSTLRKYTELCSRILKVKNPFYI